MEAKQICHKIEWQRLRNIFCCWPTTFSIHFFQLRGTLVLSYFFANICTRSFYISQSYEGNGEVYFRASWTLDLLYN